MPYTAEQMAAARDRTMEAKKIAGTRGRIGKTGRMTMQIDQEAYFNAIDQNGGVIDGKTIMDDPEYRRDMMKRHPEIVVAAEKAGARVGPFTGRARANFEAIFGQKSKYDGVVAVNVDPFSHLKV